ncbi:MAG: hypothetical protein JST94_00410 [Bacteroidetes bacterium]|nr:hypothetical protein [Bacteroidota bacterium]MBS1669914.1 hypothetical protein [Bacteroidota bacterium]
MQIIKNFCALLLVLFASTHQFTFAQTIEGEPDSVVKTLNNFSSDKQLVIGGINISGNKKTKPYIILREATFKVGDTLSLQSLTEKIQRSKEYIYNTTLFVDDSVYVSSVRHDSVFINIIVKERWYFFPLPYLRPVDRNINQWLAEGAGLDRINYGIKLTHNNFSGQNDKLNIWFITGYNQQVSLRYNLPFIDKALTKGIDVGFTLSRQHEINYATSLTNQQLFLKLTDQFARYFTRVDATYSYRPDQRQRHYFRVAYTNESITDSVFATNPNFYPTGNENLKYIDFLYAYRYINTNYLYYPTKGLLLEGSVYKRGLDKTTDLWQLSVHGLYAKTISPKTYAIIESAASIRFGNTNNFYSQSLFGYGNYQMRGLEYYVADGTAGAITRFTIGHELFKYIFHTPIIKTKTHDKIPFRFFLTAYTDVGYSYNPYVNNNLLNNKFLYTYGIGLDIVSIYDFVLRLNFSFNQMGENGLYLHARNDF